MEILLAMEMVFVIQQLEYVVAFHAQKELIALNGFVLETVAILENVIVQQEFVNVILVDMPRTVLVMIFFKYVQITPLGTKKKLSFQRYFVLAIVHVQTKEHVMIILEFVFAILDLKETFVKVILNICDNS